MTHDYNEASMGYPSDFGWASYQNQSMSNPGVVSTRRAMTKNA